MLSRLILYYQEAYVILIPVMHHLSHKFLKMLYIIAGYFFHHQIISRYAVCLNLLFDV
jgi:hypothetical protein